MHFNSVAGWHLCMLFLYLYLMPWDMLRARSQARNASAWLHLAAMHDASDILLFLLLLQGRAATERVM